MDDSIKKCLEDIVIAIDEIDMFLENRASYRPYQRFYPQENPFHKKKIGL